MAIRRLGSRVPAALALAFSGVSFAAVAIAHAQGTPPAQPRAGQIFGTRDFEMDWRVQPGDRAIRVRFQGETKRLRIEALDGSAQTMLKDLQKGEVLILVDEGKKGVFVTAGQPLPRSFGQATGRLRSVAGEQCQDFEQGGAVLCLSQDGIPLAVDSGEQKISAERIVRQTQNPALFVPPKDAKPKPIPGRQGTGPLPF